MMARVADVLLENNKLYVWDGEKTIIFSKLGVENIKNFSDGTKEIKLITNKPMLISPFNLTIKERRKKKKKKKK